METVIEAISVATAWLFFFFKKLNNSVSVQMSNNPVYKLKNNYVRFVGPHLGFPISGCIWQYFHLLKTDVIIKKLL